MLAPLALQLLGMMQLLKAANFATAVRDRMSGSEGEICQFAEAQVGQAGTAAAAGAGHGAAADQGG